MNGVQQVCSVTLNPGSLSQCDCRPFQAASYSLALCPSFSPRRLVCSTGHRIADSSYMYVRYACRYSPYSVHACQKEPVSSTRGSKEENSSILHTPFRRLAAGTRYVPPWSICLRPFFHLAVAHADHRVLDKVEALMKHRIVGQSWCRFCFFRAVFPAIAMCSGA